MLTHAGARRVVSAMLFVALVPLLAPDDSGLGPGVARAGGSACPTGWREPQVEDAVQPYDIAMLDGGRAVAVGIAKDDGIRRRIASRWWDGEAWETRLGPTLDGQDGLVGVAVDGAGDPWAVGFLERGGVPRPLAMRWDTTDWQVDGPTGPAKGGAIISDVDVDPAGRVWAVGEHLTGVAQRRAAIWRRNGTGWHRLRVEIPAASGFSAVLAVGDDDVWVAGTRSTAAGIGPLLMQWDGTTWITHEVPALGPDAGITALAATAAGQLWAVGWQSVEGRIRPLVLRTSPKGWRAVDPPDLGGTLGMLMDVSVDASGRPFVVGTVYRDAIERFVSTAARLEPDAWLVWPRPAEVGRWFRAVSGDPLADGWVLGKATSSGFALRACEPDPTPGRIGQRRPRRGPFGASGRPIGDEDATLPRPVADLPRVPRMARPAALPEGIRARDIAPEVGLGGDIKTYGASVMDVDGDGALDLFISHHGESAMLRLRRGAVYEPQATDQFPRVDRHDCELGRIDPGSQADLVCSIGADGGLGLKVNELYLDPGGGGSTEVAVEAGIADVHGRGRTMALFDADDDEDLDLFMGNSPTRYDGHASINRLYRNDGTGRFSWDPGSGLGSDRGAACAIASDLDRDGDQDLVVCGQTTAGGGRGAVVVYRNAGGSFTSTTDAWGVQPIGEVDVAVAQLGGSRRPDLVQLSTQRIRVSIWSAGRYRTVYERSVAQGRALAAGDVDGDGAVDLYLVRGGSAVNKPDLVLINGGDGRTWTPTAIPSTDRGSAEDVVALDHDGDGLMDFLVLNGRMAPGPMALIVFERG